MYYGSYGMYNGFYSASYLLVIIGAVLCLLASARVKSTYRKYAKVRSASGLTAQYSMWRANSRITMIRPGVWSICPMRPTIPLRWQPLA